jgi:hypothetical protein
MGVAGRLPALPQAIGREVPHGRQPAPRCELQFQIADAVDADRMTELDRPPRLRGKRPPGGPGLAARLAAGRAGLPAGAHADQLNRRHADQGHADRPRHGVDARNADPVGQAQASEGHTTPFDPGSDRPSRCLTGVDLLRTGPRGARRIVDTLMPSTGAGTRRRRRDRVRRSKPLRQRPQFGGARPLPHSLVGLVRRIRQPVRLCIQSSPGVREIAAAGWVNHRNRAQQPVTQRRDPPHHRERRDRRAGGRLGGQRSEPVMGRADLRKQAWVQRLDHAAEDHQISLGLLRRGSGCGHDLCWRHRWHDRWGTAGAVVAVTAGIGVSVVIGRIPPATRAAGSAARPRQHPALPLPRPGEAGWRSPWPAGGLATRFALNDSNPQSQQCQEKDPIRRPRKDPMGSGLALSHLWLRTF